MSTTATPIPGQITGHVPDHSDFLPEGTLRGLPGPLPCNERILWQGAPTARGIFLRVFHAPLVVFWFGTCGLVIAAGSEAPGRTLAAVAVALAAALLLFWLMAQACHRTTVYTLTDRRLVLHIGMALPVTYNLPFATIEGAGLHRFRDGSGDLPVQLKAGARIAYLQLWPHARPWRAARPEPMLRSVPDAQEVAVLFARALLCHRERAEGEAPLPVIVARPGNDAGPGRLVAAE